ncbi:hypothetical protein QYE76_018771 [Lolium multiflorum]|uniref:Uncharacterized protein n=1 Tax=Lolium multiflorum TaxID=4521 RepID=A0AAD8PW21_LOLMU|nr:hypothetical protein QYE76_018771 [Lolium multiflorum]
MRSSSSGGGCETGPRPRLGGGAVARGDIWAFQHYRPGGAAHGGRWRARWLAAAICAARVYYARGFSSSPYGLGIYLLNLLIGFLSPWSTGGGALAPPGRAAHPPPPEFMFSAAVSITTLFP